MKFVSDAACVCGAPTVCIPLAQCSSPHFMRRNSYLPAWVMSQLSGERMYQMLASLSEKERNRFLNQVQANPTFKGVERLQEEPSASTAGDEAAASEPPASSATPQEMGMDFMDTVATEDLPEEVVHPPAVAAPPAQTPAPAACPALSKAKQGLPVPMKTPPPRSADDGQAQAPPKLWPKQGAASPAWCRRRPKPRKSPPCRLPQLRQLSRRRLSPLFPRRRAKLAKRLKHHFHRLRVNLVSLRWIVRPAWQLKLRPAGLAVSSTMPMATRFFLLGPALDLQKAVRVL